MFLLRAIAVALPNLNRAPALLVFGAFLIAVLGMGISAQAQTQITKSARIELNDQTPRIFIGKDLYLTPDKESKLNAKAIAARHQNNLKGALHTQNILNLGPQTQPIWLSFSVTNNSFSEDWVLHFGDIFDGRLALIRNIQIYNASDNKIILQSAMSGQEAVNLNRLQGSAVSLKLPLNQKQVFVLYLETVPGSMHTLTPSFMSGESYQAYLSEVSFFKALFWVFILGGVGFFIAFGTIQRHLTYLLFGGYLLSYAGLIYGFKNTFFLAGTFSPILLGLLFILPLLFAIFLTRRFLDLRIGHDFSNILLLMSGGGIVFGFILSQVLSSMAGNIDEYLLFIPLLVGWAFLCALCYSESQQEHHGALYMAGAWLCGFIGCLTLFLSALGNGNTGLLLSCYWGMLVPQTGLLVMAALQNLHMSQKEEFSTFARDNRAAQSLARIKQSKESADQARLLRVIERERELMAELREREMQRTQEMRKAKDAADEANRAKSAFLAVVSHEIRTPMNGILGMLRLLIDTKMSKDQTEYVQAIQNSGDTMMALLNDILDFEKIESGNMEIEIIDFDLIKLIEGIVTLMSGHAAEKGLSLKADIKPDFPAVLKGDPTRLRQVLLNLVNNAVKFTADGSVTLELSAAPRDGDKDGVFYDVTCAIKDTGIGISEGAQKELFNPFTQADKSTSRKYGGTGLGLAICRRLVEAMGSKIQLQSEEDKGSQFFFTLKMEQGQQDFSENALDIGYNEPSRPEIKPMRILIIDDNEMNRRVLDGFLSKDSHMLTMLESGEEALEICQSERFDVIICDIRLLGMDGMEFTRALREFDDSEIAATPVIPLSGDVSAEDRKAYGDAGMSGFLAKPLDPQALFEVLLSVQNGLLQAGPSREQKEDALKSQETMIHEGSKAGNFDDVEINDHFDSFEFPEEEPEAAASEPEKSGQLFDPKLLQGLVESLPKDQFDELLQSFLDKTDELVSTLERAKINKADMEAVQDRAHELKGMAANFGLIGVSDIATDIEAAAKNDESQAAFTAIDKIAAVNIEAQAALKSWVASQQ